jgi:hypothetical protein
MHLIEKIQFNNNNFVQIPPVKQLQMKRAKREEKSLKEMIYFTNDLEPTENLDPEEESKSLSSSSESNEEEDKYQSFDKELSST